ncbi:hybrid sensor histidine kinase/response regulator [uncultured Thiodictyon sp.]|uniref:hybrid sensor histidine kinase/response regulator n=1 Tax=uncultured Thiodictyon sp. TaxID=1846217 RepID=UPI0025F7BD40|nr:hybrid sensor histidine kinase/response regulator [uncultured Thiodictyon sp.]
MNDLLEIFREEVEANLKEGTRLTLEFEHAPPDRAGTEALMRVFHTLKGAARAVQCDQELDIAHRLEDVLHDQLDGSGPWRPATVDLCLMGVDLLHDTLAARLAGAPWPDMAGFAARVDAYRAGLPEPPPAPTPAPPMDRGTDGGFGLDLMGIFAEEVVGQLAEARALLAVGTGASNAEDLRRVFHTLKGAARAIGCDPIRTVAGALEDLLHESGTAGNPAPFASLPLAVDCGLRWIESLLAILRRGAEAPSLTPLLEQLARQRETGQFTPCSPPVLAAEARPALEGPAAEPPVTPTRPVASAPTGPPLPVVSTAPANGPANRSAGGQRTRLAYEQLDRLHRLSGELTVAVASLAGQRNQLRGLTRELTRAGQHLGRLVAGNLTDDLDREALHESLRQVAQRLATTAGGLDGLTDTHDRMEGRLHHLADGLADEVTQARLLPLSDLFDDYPRMVRDLAQELGKWVELHVEGQDNRIDRAVLEQLRNPLLHLLRNALDHGIESPAVRESQGKPAVGRLTLEAHRVGARMRLRVSDDGAGIDLGRLQAAVVAAGHTTPALWAQLGSEERTAFLFLPGLTTAASLSTTSGRGFGLDIVKAGIESSGGSVAVYGEPGRGTCFELHVPLSLSLTRCLLVVGGRHPLFGDQRYAFPMTEVARVRRLVQDELRELEGRLAVHLDGETLPLFQLHTLLGLAPIHQDLQRKHLLVLDEGGGRFGLLVEAVVDELDMVARPLDERLGKVAEIAGLTLLDDGGVALIMDVPDLLQRLREGAGYLAPAGLQAATDSAEEAAAPAQVLVVEDSVTVREVERHFLEQAGYQVTTAVNGMDGLNKAKAGDHRILITDIDMPRMNGIELIRTLRGMDRFRQLPIIVVSYKDRAEDRNKAMEAGADRYVTKSEFDTDAMLAMVAQLLANSPARIGG